MMTATQAIRTRTARDVMQIQVVAVVPEMTVRELIQMLVEEEISGAPVVDPSGKVIGVVSMTDVMRLASHEAEIPSGQLAWDPVLLPEEESYGGEIEAVPPFTAPEPGSPAEAAFDEYRVRDIMTPVAFSVSASDTIPELLRFFLRGRVHRALVVENGTLLGIVTPFDVLQLIENEMA